MKCPPSYETYIDIFQSGHVKYVIWQFFRQQECLKSAICRNCSREIAFESEITVLVNHLKLDHNNEESDNGSYYSYDNYIKDLGSVVKNESYNFPKLNKKDLKISFGVKIADKHTLVRFPLSRIGRTIYQEKTSYLNDWQKKVCQEYTNNPVGSYQGHFDQPMTTNVYKGNLPLSFAKYTEFTHTPTEVCQNYEINKKRYKNIDDIKKLEALVPSTEVSTDNMIISGPCSKDQNQSLIYTCIKHRCIFPCVCKDCVEDEGQCEDHTILHPGYFLPEQHALTVRMHDSYNINLIQDDFAVGANRIVEVVKYAGIEKDEHNCRKCPRDLLHHQAYHFVHHNFCKFCKNEELKYKNAVTKNDFQSNLKEKHRLENLACHMCNKIFDRLENKNNHIRTQHSDDSRSRVECDKCERVFQSMQAMRYHNKIVHLEEPEQHNCPVCDKVFYTKHSVDVHSRSVHNLRKFYCRICSNKFTRQSNLLKHYKFVHEIDMKKYYHGETDHGKLDLYTCNQCDFKTIYSSNLKQHKEFLHSVEKKTFLSCKDCSFKTTYKKNLVAHIKVHAKEVTIFKCDSCDFSTKYERSLTRHRKDKHDGE